MKSTKTTTGENAATPETTRLTRSWVSSRDPYSAFATKPFLVLDWLTTGVVLAEVKANNSGGQVIRSVFAEWPKHLSPLASPTAAGEWLKSLCQAEKFPTHHVAISISRPEVNVRLLEIPNVDLNDVGPIVALQVESRTLASGQPVFWDCLIHESKVEDQHRYVTLITAPQKTIESVQAASRAAGLEQVWLTSGDVAVHTISQARQTKWQVDVHANPVKLELLLCRYGVPAASYATAMPLDQAEAAALICTMTRRLIAGTPAIWQTDDGTKVQFETSIRLHGSRAQEIGAVLKHSVNQLTIDSNDQRSTRPIGIAASLLAPDHRLDFLRPRSVDGRIRIYRNRRNGLVAALTAASVASTVGLWSWHTSLDSELADLTRQTQLLKQTVDRGQDAVTKWSFVSRWKKTTVNGPMEIQKIAALLPERDRLIVTRLQLENAVDAKESVMRIDGLAKNSDDVLQLNGKILEKTEDFELRPHGIEPSPAGSQLPSQFRLEAVLQSGSQIQSRGR